MIYPFTDMLRGYIVSQSNHLLIGTQLLAVVYQFIDCKQLAPLLIFIILVLVLFLCVMSGHLLLVWVDIFCHCH